MQELSIVVYASDADEAASIIQVLNCIPHVRVVGQADDELGNCLEDLTPDAFFAGLGCSPHRTLDMIDALPAGKPPFFVWGGQDDTSVLLRSMRMGAVEYLPSLDPGAILTRPRASTTFTVSSALWINKSFRGSATVFMAATSIH